MDYERAAPIEWGRGQESSEELGKSASPGLSGGGDLTAAEALIEAGIEVNKAGDLGYSPLHVACVQGNTEMVKRRWLVRHQQSAS
jgi:Ankyrin repeat